MSIYVTGDTHGDFRHIAQFCKSMDIKQEDIMIVLGDAGLNYYDDLRDAMRKQDVSRIPVTFFFVHGNHEIRSENVDGYELIDWHGGKVWRQSQYPRLNFAQDGEIYDLAGKQILAIGGAYSIDKDYRLAMGYRWFPDEQPSAEIKTRVERKLGEVEWKVDVVLSHTCPRKYEPTECFLPNVNQSMVDKSTEDWLDKIEDRLDYKRWYCGHWHTNKQIDRIEFLFHNVRLF